MGRGGNRGGVCLLDFPQREHRKEAAKKALSIQILKQRLQDPHNEVYLKDYIGRKYILALSLAQAFTFGLENDWDRSMQVVWNVE